MVPRGLLRYFAREASWDQLMITVQLRSVNVLVRNSPAAIKRVLCESFLVRVRANITGDN